MKRTHKISLTALALAASFGSAFAADLASKKAPPPTSDLPPLWTGIYSGVNIGGGWSTIGNNGNYFNGNGWNAGDSNRPPSGAIGGLQIGYNLQISPMFVAGLETDFQGTTMGSASSITNSAFYTNQWQYSLGTSINWYGSVRARAGVAVLPSVLLYGTGGFAYADISRNGIAPFGTLQTGWTGGGGGEWMFLPNWSAKAEYLYTQTSGGPSQVWGAWPALYKSYHVAAIPVSITNQTGWNNIRAGVNYHFAWGATSSLTGQPIGVSNYNVPALNLPVGQSYEPGKLTQASTASARPAVVAASATNPALPVAAAANAQSPIPGLAPATGAIPDISFSDIIHQ
jgi:outer membrane immunogenic protein